jgi:transcriptional regulator with XRE-family HTH domain
MSPFSNAVLTDVPSVRVDRTWTRELLARAGVTQRELSRAWGVADSQASRWLDGHRIKELSLRHALTFCGMTGIGVDELAARLGLEQPDGSRVALAPVDAPPLPTIRITPSGKAGKWLFLAHVEVSADSLTGITRAFDEAAADRRVVRARELSAAIVAETA